MGAKCLRVSFGESLGARGGVRGSGGEEEEGGERESVRHPMRIPDYSMQPLDRALYSPSKDSDGFQG